MCDGGCSLFLSVLFQFLRSGGEELLDELSLSRQGRVGEIIITKGHNFNIRSKSSFFKKGVVLILTRTKIHDLWTGYRKPCIGPAEMII